MRLQYHRSSFCLVLSAAGTKRKRQRNNSDQYNGLGEELGPDTGVYCLALFVSHSHTHTETDNKYTHTYSGTTYILTSKHIYLICIDNFVIYHKTKQSPNINKHLWEFRYDWCVLSVNKVFLWGNVWTVEIKNIIPVLSTLFMLIRHHHNCIFCDYHCVMTCQR